VQEQRLGPQIKCGVWAYVGVGYGRDGSRIASDEGSSGQMVVSLHRQMLRILGGLKQSLFGMLGVGLPLGHYTTAVI